MTSKTKTSIFFMILSLMAGIAATQPAAAASGAQATFIATDTTTQGNWQGTYGNDGYSIADTTTNQVPGYVAFTPQNQSNWIWTSDGAETRDLQVPSSIAADMRQASCWYTRSSHSYDLDVNISDGHTHQVALYALDWDSRGRTETIQAVDGVSGAVLDTRNLSNFANGIYDVWNVSGNVKFNITVTGGVNAVISAAFFDPANANVSTGSAQFVATDTSTQGNWPGLYGADGYTVVGGGQVTPSYAAVTTKNQSNWTWAANTTDPRALLRTSSGSARVAATWFNGSTFSVDVNVTDGKTHQFALYAEDWDYQGRAETLQVIDAQTKSVLDSRSIFGFTNGVYVVWNISGHVTVTVTDTGGPNSVISGAFFGGSGGTTPITGTPTTTTPAQPVASQGYLSLQASSFSFGSVNIGTSVVQAFTISNSGTSAVTLSSVSVAGAGLSATGVSDGTIIAPGQSATLEVAYTPAAAVALNGGVTFISNASDSSVSLALTGTGVQPPVVVHSVTLNWDPSSSEGVVGYNVYRSTVSGGSYTLLTTSPVSAMSYVDTSAQGGQTYYYAVTSVDVGGVQSTYSNVASVVIP